VKKVLLKFVQTLAIHSIYLFLLKIVHHDGMYNLPIKNI